MKSSIREFAIICLACALVTAVFTACQPQDEPQKSVESKTYTMSIRASKGTEAESPADGSVKRVLSLNGDTLNASWAQGERVTVYNITKAADLGGYLEAQDNAATTALIGTLTGTIEGGDALKLKFLSPSYDLQEGTLEYIAEYCDYAEATVTVADVTDGTITITEPTAAFENQQAIVKFTPTDIANGDSLNLHRLIVTAGQTTVTAIYPLGMKEVFVAIPAISDQAVSLTAITTSNYICTYERASVTFANSQYYDITVKMTKQYIDLSWIVSDVIAMDGDELRGSMWVDQGGNFKVSIADSATVTLGGITINGVDQDNYEWAGITCLGDATIILKDGTTNTVRGFNSMYPGISIPENKTLTIQGTGSLDVSCNGSASGIGGGDMMSCGSIIINGGNITATGGGGAGIGGGLLAYCGDIAINGGTITAIGGTGAPGIGSGAGGPCSTISITGGNVTATGGQYGAGIGTGMGSGLTGSYDTIIIRGGTVEATGGQYGAGIGGGYNYFSCGDINIIGGTVTATGGVNAAGIGSGHYISGYEPGAFGNITIYNTVTRVTALRGDSAVNSIGAGVSSSCDTVTIGGTVYWGETTQGSGTYEYKNGGDTYLTASPLVYQP